MADPVTTGQRRSRAVRLAAAVAVVGAAAAGVYLAVRPRPPADPPDPRIAYGGPFRNVHPGVEYVPDARCAECHQDVCHTYARHPMGRSAAGAANGSPPAGPGQNNPFAALGSEFRVDRVDGKTWHRRVKAGPDGRPAVTQEWEVAYTIGSGGRGHSYLAGRDGFVFMTPVSWYSQSAKWDLSPGFTPAHAAIGRRVAPGCLYCHVNRADHIPDTLNRYADPPIDGPAIGCQRCHGPGALHVAERAAGPAGAAGPDYTIVNPRHLDRPLREAVCEQCHLQGETRVLGRGRDWSDYRPGLGAEWFWSVLVREEPGKKAVGHVEQMHQSRCFQESTGPRALGCVSCHNPHAKESPDQRVAHYRGRCLECHADRGCSVPEPHRREKVKDDSCIACHMPRFATSDIPHTAVTDHRIVRRPDAPFRPADPARAPADGMPLVSFYRGRPGLPEAEDARARAVAAVRYAAGGAPEAGRAVQSALPVLDEVCRRDRGDLPAAEARAQALALAGRPQEALAAFEAILAGWPGREASLAGAAGAATAVGQTDAALGYWRRAAAVNPHAPEYWASLATLLIKQEAWDEAGRAAADWVRVDPFSPEARTARVTCLLALGDKAGARAEFAKLEVLAPANLQELRFRFERKLR